MKEIKTYTRRCCVNETVRSLEKEGAPGIMVVEVHPVGYGYDHNYFEIHHEDNLKRYGHLKIVKIEVVCTEKDCGRFVDTILKVCRTGDRSDGMFFIADVSGAIRTREEVSREGAL